MFLGREPLETILCTLYVEVDEQKLGLCRARGSRKFKVPVFHVGAIWGPEGATWLRFDTGARPSGPVEADQESCGRIASESGNCCTSSRLYSYVPRRKEEGGVPARYV